MSLPKQVVKFRITDYKNLSNDELYLQCEKIDKELEQLNRNELTFKDKLMKVMQVVVKAQYAYSEAIKRAGLSENEMKHAQYRAKLESLLQGVSKN